MDTDALRYSRIRYRLLLVHWLTGVAWLAFVQGSGASVALARWWAKRLPSESLVILGYLAVVGMASYLVTLPVHYYGGFVLERRFGLSRLTGPGWLRREVKHLGLRAVISLALVEGLYALLRGIPNRWPMWATIGWVLFSVVLARVFPTLLLPLLYRTTPLHDSVLARRLLNLCRRAGLSVLGVFRVELGTETRKANAALAGLGTTRRVLVSDTLLCEFSPEEIEGVLAHELAHERYHHIHKLLFISAVGSWIAFWLTAHVSGWWIGALRLASLSDIAGFPMLLLWFSLLGMIGLPLQQGISRGFEWQADRFAVELTKQPRAFANALRRLAQLNLADPNPPRWIVWFLYDHPPITERIRAAEQADLVVT